MQILVWLLCFLASICFIYILFAVGPVDCEWSEWNMYGQCSVTCGEGTFKKYRYKSVEEKNGGTCSGEEDTIDTCMTPCPGMKT